MPENIYQQLARHLDDLPGGFPKTESGVELRILRRMFTPREAEMALNLTLIFEEAKVVARRAQAPVEETAAVLEKMSQKGLIYRLPHKGKPPRYMAAQFVIGIWEMHVNKLDPGLIRDFNEYVPVLFNLQEWKKAPQLRTVPVEQSLDHKLEVFPFENAADLVKENTKFLEAPCICRKERRIMGEDCGKPEGNCLIMGAGVDIYQNAGIGREISRAQALALLEKADEAGLVLQPSFSKKISNICCCCGCCCQVLKNIKKHPHPSAQVSSPFMARLDPEPCSGCGVCVDRCQMGALQIKDEKAILDGTKCIGCGLCVSACPTGALRLQRKPAREQIRIPDKITTAAVQRLRIRGKLGAGRVSSLLLRSKKDRLLSRGKPV